MAKLGECDARWIVEVKQMFNPTAATQSLCSFKKWSPHGFSYRLITVPIASQTHDVAHLQRTITDVNFPLDRTE